MSAFATDSDSGSAHTERKRTDESRRSAAVYSSAKVATAQSIDCVRGTQRGKRRDSIWLALGSLRHIHIHIHMATSTTTTTTTAGLPLDGYLRQLRGWPAWKRRQADTEAYGPAWHRRDAPCGSPRRPTDWARALQLAVHNTTGRASY